ncbi:MULTISPECIES: hypothetical protein [unclassified Thioalkalivibrio]|uniref:hypothetical protein n=1 Tax=unclassified Thioalkalivibrio TaxID=2621013 RepID=UPI00037CE274|nr:MULTISPECIES: hypothetical protein [unclassified Thioalkalivibrio]
MRAFRKERAPVWWPVQVVEAADHGETETYEFEARIRPLSTDQVNQLSAGSRPDPVGLLLEHVVDWSGPHDPDTGAAIPFSRETLEQYLGQSIPLLHALERALQEVSTGGGAAKNSKTSRAG